MNRNFFTQAETQITCTEEEACASNEITPPDYTKHHEKGFVGARPKIDQSHPAGLESPDRRNSFKP